MLLHIHYHCSLASQKAVNLSRKLSTLLFSQLMTSRMKGTLAMKKSPGNTLTFCSAKSCLASYTLLLRRSFWRSTMIVAYRAPAEQPNLQQDLPSSAFLRVSWFSRISFMHSPMRSSLLPFSRIPGRAACMTVFGMRITLKIPRSSGRQNYLLASPAQRMIHPMRHPGPKYLFVNPEHLKIVIWSASSGFTSSAKVGTMSAQSIPSQISSASRGSCFRLQSSRIQRLCYADQLEPRGFEGSLTSINLVRQSMSASISATELFHLFQACRWYTRGSSPMLLAMVRARGNPGDGKRKLSPASASKFMVAQMAKLPPAHRQT